MTKLNEVDIDWLFRRIASAAECADRISRNEPGEFVNTDAIRWNLRTMHDTLKRAVERDAAISVSLSEMRRLNAEPIEGVERILAETE